MGFYDRIKNLIPYTLFFPLLLYSPYAEFAVRNLILQHVLFLFTALIPAYMTKRMSWVDIAWPWGLVLLGAQAGLYGTGFWIRKYAITAMFLAAGLRMGLGALYLWKVGGLNKELPRYQYQQRRWEKHGETNYALAMQLEIVVQSACNSTFFLLPVLLNAFNDNPQMHPLEYVGYALWFASLYFESVADAQKLKFAAKCKKEGLRGKVCNIGLWQYSRHPNYFGEWMVWNSLILTSIPSWLDSQAALGTFHWVAFGLGLAMISYTMYFCLVFYTGAIPAEYYSLQKRPEYAEYKQRVNMFFPGPQKKVAGKSQ
eukprot:GFYU01001494.1.p1 GENE.GFYU01001494.1~~GFYU01001494.1.p1  ORF type:complete len:313 (+),score=94.84 GFYU01001494.1:143-1081(+)